MFIVCLIFFMQLCIIYCLWLLFYKCYAKFEIIFCNLNLSVKVFPVWPIYNYLYYIVVMLFCTLLVWWIYLYFLIWNVGYYIKCACYKCYFNVTFLSMFTIMFVLLRTYVNWTIFYYFLVIYLCYDSCCWLLLIINKGIYRII